MSESAALQRTSVSPQKRAYSDALVKAIDRYEREVRNHKSDPPASRWVAWPARGYRLRAMESPSMPLLVLGRNESQEIPFGVGIETPGQPCVATAVARRALSFEGKSILFDGRCIDGTLAFIPINASDRLRFKQRIEKGGRVSLKSVGETGTFDLSGVPVLNAMLAAEELGLPPD